MTDPVTRSIPDPLMARVPLSWTVFVTSSVPTDSDDLPPGETVLMWSPISSTLIYGERDAVLVDAPTTVEQAKRLGRRSAFGAFLTRCDGGTAEQAVSRSNPGATGDGGAS
jgi:hypothetical protein